MYDDLPDIDTSVREVTAGSLKARIDANERVVVVDTRRREDFETWHVDGGSVTPINVPFTEFLDGDDPAAAVPESLLDALPEEYDPPVVTCCAKSASSRYVAEFLDSEGFDVAVLANGMRGWAGLYEANELEDDAAPAAASVVQFHRPATGCLAYLVVSGDDALVVDSLRAFANEYAAAADERDATLAYAVDTHVHADHVSGVTAVADATDATPLVPAGATERGYVGDARFVHAGDELDVGDVTVSAIALPGHASELLGYRVGDVLVAGDTLFAAAVGRPDLEAGDEDARDAARRLYDTIQELGTLPEDTLVAPGHASGNARPRDDGTYAATLAELRERLPAFERDREAFVDAVLAGLGSRPNSDETIVDVNLGTKSVSDTDAFELELGPNNSAAGE